MEIDRRKTQQYDPTSVSGRELGVAHKAVLFETRKRFLEQVADIGLAPKMTRLRRLERYVNRLEERDNLLGAMQALKQTAKECGGAFTNARIHSGPGSGPMQHEVKMTDRERAEAILDLFQRVAIADESGNGEGADAVSVADLFERAASGSGGKVGG